MQRFLIDDLTLNDLVAECAGELTAVLQNHHTQIRFRSGPIETLPLPQNLDLIASASTVQWVADPAALITRLTRHLAPGGWLAISGFGRSHFSNLTVLGSGAQAPSYLDPHDWRAILPDSLHLHCVTSDTLTLRFPTAIALLRHLRDTGVNAQARGQWTKRSLIEFETRMQASQPGCADLRLCYNPVILIAQKSL